MGAPASATATADGTIWVAAANGLFVIEVGAAAAMAVLNDPLSAVAVSAPRAVCPRLCGIGVY